MNILNRFTPIIFLVFGLIFSVLIWDYISLPYDETNKIIGQYSENKFNPLNDTIRGISFISIPLLLYIITFLKINKSKINYNFFKIDQNYLDGNNNKNINYLIFILISFSILEFFNLNHNNFINNIDSHHEGTSLSAQLNFFKKDGYWSGTFYDYGFLGNNIGVFSRYIFDNYSIGIQRFTFVFLILINKIFLILICGQLVKILNIKNNKCLFFLLFVIATLTLANFNEHITPFHSRIFIFLIFTFFVFKIVNSKKDYSILYLLVGSFSAVSLLFYYDIGTYINALILILLGYLILLKKYLKVFQILLGIFLSWLIFITFVSIEEFNEFIRQYYVIVNISDYLLGIEYPKPFSEKSTRHTKALLLIILTGVILVNFIFSIKDKQNYIAKFYLIFLFISSIIFFKSGLMRSDTPHIKYTSGIYTMILFFFISYYISKVLQKFRFYKKIKIIFEKKSYLLILSILIYFPIFLKDNFMNFTNLMNSNKNFLMLTKTEDNRFLDKNYLKFINEYKILTKDENCVQQFTDDNAIPYLVNKPTCTKFYVNAHIVDGWTDKIFIKELRRSNPEYILYSSTINWFKSRNNAKNADQYILKNYKPFKKISDWEIYKKK